MTQEEKQLLFKDLSARLPYGVKLDNGLKLRSIDALTQIVSCSGSDKKIDCIKPYLRPLSSMTEEEEGMYNLLQGISHLAEQHWTAKDGKVYRYADAIDWLNEHHFDYRGLIEKGLALEAPDGMYSKEESEKGSEIPIPKTVDEAVKTLAKIVSKEDRDYLLENGAISMHDSLGRWIRNEWGLWTGSELKDELMSMNKGLNHPDDMSNYIIEEFIKYCLEKI